MKKNLTEIVFILDRSGSMAGLESDTIGGYNAMLEKQKKEKGEAFVSTVLFDNTPTVIHDRVRIKNAPYLTEKDYSVRGCTALFDAVGGAIHHIGNIHKYARREDVPDKTLFIITTDGMENASKRYSLTDVKNMINRQQEKYGWEFLFLGANMDAGAVGEQIGIRRERSATYQSDAYGTQLNFSVMSEAISSFRCAGAMSDDWKEKIESRDDGKK